MPNITRPTVTTSTVTRGVVSGSSVTVPAGGGGGVTPDPLELFLTGGENTPFRDVSGNGQTLSLNGSSPPVQTSAQAQFGSGSIRFPGGSASDDTAFSYADARGAVGEGDYTWEAFVRRDASQVTTFATLWSIPTRTNGPFLQMVSASGQLLWVMQTSPGSFGASVPGGIIAADTFVHVALVKEGDRGSVYINGTRTGTSTSFFTARDWDDVAFQTHHIGGNSVDVFATEGSFAGFMDEIRVRTEAVYTGASYTVPTAAFPRPT